LALAECFNAQLTLLYVYDSPHLYDGQAGKFAAQRKGRRGLVKQRRVLLGLREAVMERIQELAAEAREENPSFSLHMADAATDTIDRDVFLGLVSFEQEAANKIDGETLAPFPARLNRSVEKTSETLRSGRRVSRAITT
jgi:hypothetical protein